MKKAFGLAKAHGHHKGLDTAIVKATNYDHALPKEKHIRTIFQSLSPSKPRSEVVYCIHGLARRLSQTYNWAVAVKALIVIHRAMRELDSTVWVELVNYRRGNGCLINIAHFRDSSSPYALDYSAWIHNYALYLEDRLQCFLIMNYDVGTNSSKFSQKLDTKELLDQLPALQNLLFRLLDCKPGGAATHNRLIQYALSVVAGESVKLYVAITVKVVELLDKFFEMHCDDATKALEIYQKSGHQAERLSEFFETCRGLDFGRGQKFINIKMPPASFMSTMEEYIKDAPCTLMLEYNVKDDDKVAASESAAPVGDLLPEVNQDSEKNETSTPTQAADLMGLYDLLTGASEFEENSLALAIVPIDHSSSSSNDENGPSPITGWEDALFTEPEPESFTENVVAVGGLEVSKLENLYDNAITVTQQNEAYQIGQVASNPFDFGATDYNQYNMTTESSTIQNAYYGPSNMTPQMVGIPYQDYYMMHQQQPQEPFVMNKKSNNPFDEPNMLALDMPSLPTQST
ncbi:PREDICTED: putative clathrin assembly protein At5g35200 isoform X3 [Lupinus angustifolius]|uniref:putative clathrin assembly protein At5g35200 isoform X3 n=1 Tax=Lupinus angustifolius TaxID=3871 RepID=UPI00092FC219|nr:PREDICTED: putative clathrin assembly protein At5g35200 isoform X3 [Lupinus angustifolius]